MNLWPPNNKLVDVQIIGVTDPDGDGDAVTVTITGITHDEPLVDAPGRGDCPAATGVGTATASLQATRAGQGDGRVYRIAFRARDTRGGQCTSSVTVCVPHDQGGGRTCGDQGPLVDATDRMCALVCDAQDPCVAASCIAPPGRLDAPGIRFAAVRCAFIQQRLPIACDGIPPTIQRRLDQASALIEHGGQQTQPRWARRLVSRAARAAARASRRLARPEVRATLAPECVASLRTALDDARERARRWLAAQ